VSDFKKAICIKMKIISFLLLSALSCLSARAATSITYYGITWTFSADRPVGTFANGEPWVQGPVTITAINPNPSTSTGLVRINTSWGGDHYFVDGIAVNHGSMVNPVPGGLNGFDRRLDLSAWNVADADKVSYRPALNAALQLPKLLNGGDVLVSSISQIPAGSNDVTWLKTVCALTVMASPPPAGSFRPSIFGPAAERADLFNTSQLNYSVLKNFNATPGLPPKAAIAGSMPGLPWFEWYKYQNGNQFQPVDNTADGNNQYGRNIAIKFGTVGLWLNTNQTFADKQAIAIQMVQCGLDIAAYLRNGGGFYHDGGVKMGRKLPLIFAAMMLNDSGLKTLAGNPTLFQEDQQIWLVTQADVGRAIEPVYNPYPPPQTYIQADVGVAEWGVRHLYEPYSDNRNINTGYRYDVSNFMMASWLCTHLMGGRSVWNHPPAFAYMERWYGIDPGAGTTLTSEMYVAYKNTVSGFGMEVGAGLFNPTIIDMRIQGIRTSRAK
jgi:hypothetical protein